MKTNFEGRYMSTYGFVALNDLEKQAEKTFGKDWEAESDVEQIQELCDNIEKGRYHVYCIETRDDEDIVVRESDNWELSTDKLKELLENRGFYTGNLWHVEDIKGMFKCDDDEAQDVLDSALTNEATMDRIWFAIRFHADEYGLKELEEVKSNKHDLVLKSIMTRYGGLENLICQLREDCDVAYVNIADDTDMVVNEHEVEDIINQIIT